MTTVKEKIQLQLEVLRKQAAEVAEKIDEQLDKGLTPRALMLRRDYLNEEIEATEKLLSRMNANATA